MKQKKLANLLKLMIIGVGVCGLFVYAMVIPPLGKEMLFAVLLTSSPFYVALVHSWKIMSNIANDDSFTIENADLLAKIASLARIDSVFLLAWSVLFFTINLINLQILVVSLFIVFIGIVVAAIFTALSHLVMKAADLQDQYDLTI